MPVKSGLLLSYATAILEESRLFYGEGGGVFPNMERCIISYQEVLRSVVKNVYH